MVVTRKRATPSAAPEAPVSSPKKRQRRSQPAPSPSAAPVPPLQSPIRRSPPKAGPQPLPKGRRGAALLAKLGVAVPDSPQPATLTSPPKAAFGSSPSPRGASPRQAPKRASPRKDYPLLRQPLPKNYTPLQDFFAALQVNYGMLRKRGQRCTYQNLRAAVEEHTGKRFLMSHLAQLQYLLPDVISLEWVRLPVDPHSTRTEPHLAIALAPMPEQWERPAAAPAAAEAQQQQPQGQAQRSGAAGSASAAAEAGPRPSKGPWGVAGDADVPLLRQLLHFRLAEQLLGEYRQHLEAGAQKLRAAGEAAAAEEMEAQLLAIPSSGSSGQLQQQQQQRQQQPVRQFAGGFLEAVPEVPQQRLPLRPEASSGVPPIGASPAAVSSHLAPLGTPLTATPAVPASSRRPPLPPPSSRATRPGQRRLSFGGGAAMEPGVPEPSSAQRLPFRSTKAAGTPLDKLEKQLMGGSSAARGLGSIQGPTAVGAQGEDAGQELFNGRILTEEEQRVWDALPETAKRLSLDGIMSLEAHMAVEATARQHEIGSSKAAQEARALRGALGQLPKAYMRLQRIFGMQGSNAIKLQQVVARLRSSEEMSSEAELEAQVRLLAEHAPEVCSLRPFGSCGTPAVWWDRRADRASNGGIYKRLKGVADARHTLAAGPGAAVGPALAGLAATQ